MKQISKKRKITFLLIGLLLVTVVGATIAYFTSQKEFENEFQVKSPGVAVEEKFNPADHWVPGEEKSKEVWFTNTGELDMLLRFSVEVKWDESVPHPNREPEDVIELYWYGGKKENSNESIRIPANPSDKTDTDSPDGTSTDPPYGTDTAPVEFRKIIQDGKAYYYYEKVLKAGESTQHTLESVKFKTNLSNDGHKNSDFSNTQLLVTIRGETVLAEPAAVTEWTETPQIKAVINGDNVEWSVEPEAPEN